MSAANRSETRGHSSSMSRREAARAGGAPAGSLSKWRRTASSDGWASPSEWIARYPILFRRRPASASKAGEPAWPTDGSRLPSTSNPYRRRAATSSPRIKAHVALWGYDRHARTDSGQFTRLIVDQALTPPSRPDGSASSPLHSQRDLASGSRQCDQPSYAGRLDLAGVLQRRAGRRHGSDQYPRQQWHPAARTSSGAESCPPRLSRRF